MSFLRRLDRAVGAERLADHVLDAGAMRPAAPPPQYWFTAKRYGWGWGLPCSWQGWCADLAFVVVLLVATLVGGLAGTVLVLVAAAGLVGLAAWKGEPPSWRWG